MTIKFYHRNIVDVKDGIIAHGANTRGVMGSGVAAALRSEYPEMFTQYQKDLQKYSSNKNALGDVSWYVKDDLYIASCFTQVDFGTDRRHASYPAIACSFRNVMKQARTMGLEFVNTVPIGMGLAGGDPAVIMPILEDLTNDFGIDIHMSIYDRETFKMLAHGNE